MGKCIYDVFISYCRVDYLNPDNTVNENSAIHKLLCAFNDAGIDYWIDKEKNEVGSAFLNRISDAIRDSRVFIFISSAASNKEPEIPTAQSWPQMEVYAATQMYKKEVIPLKIDNTPYYKPIEIMLGCYTFDDVDLDDDAKIHQCVQVIKDKLRKIYDREEKQAIEEERRKIKYAEEEKERKEKEEARLRKWIEYNAALSVLQQTISSLKEKRYELIRKIIDEGYEYDQTKELDSDVADIKDKYDQILDSHKTLEEIRGSLETKIQLLEKQLAVKDKEIEKIRLEFSRQSGKVQPARESMPAPVKKFNLEHPTTKTIICNGIHIEMVLVEGGSFNMGATPEQERDAYEDERSIITMNIPSYYIAKYEVIQDLWISIMGRNPSINRKGGIYPVDNISYDEAYVFAMKLSDKTGYHFSIPTEAQWEFAARGGNKTMGYKYSGSDVLDEVAWYMRNANNKTHPVGLKRPNELGLYDMSGNVLEWCNDAINDRPTKDHSSRILRGGCFFHEARRCRVSAKNLGRSSNKSSNYGLRLVMNINPSDL